MSRIVCQLVDDVAAQFFAYLRQFVYGQSAQVGRDIDLRQKVICIFVCHQHTGGIICHLDHLIRIVSDLGQQICFIVNLIFRGNLLKIEIQKHQSQAQRQHHKKSHIKCELPSYALVTRIFTFETHTQISSFYI